MSKKNGTVELCIGPQNDVLEDTFRRLLVQTGFWSDLLFEGIV